VLLCVDLERRQQIGDSATDEGSGCSTILSTPSLFDLLLSFAIVVESDLLGPIASIIVTLHQAAQAVYVVLCLACYDILKTRREVRLWSLIAWIFVDIWIYLYYKI
jgi:hypothetical protein